MSLVDDQQPIQTRFTLGNRPIANELRALGMDLTPERFEYAPHLKSTLGKPVRVAGG